MKNILKTFAAIAAIITLTANLTFAQNQYINVLTGKNLVISTNDTARMIITTGGKVGIGTTNPTANFEIAGDMSINGNASIDNNLTVKNLSASMNIITNIIEVNRLFGDSLRTNYLYSKNLYTDSVMYIQNDTANMLTRNTIVNANNSGRVGIGTSNPTEKLSVTGNVKISDTLKIEKSLRIDSLAGAGFKFDSTDTKSYKIVLVDETGEFTVDPPANFSSYDITPWILGGNTLPSTNYKIGTRNSKPFRMITNNVERMRITEIGNVGIGTTNFSDGEDEDYYKLSVNGSVRAKEVVVETGWSDFVFDKNYTLMPLKELENYITQNKHLPDVPTSDEITKNGVSLGKTQSLLLQKIEELTLYVIELKKESDNIKKDNEQLKNRIFKLEKNDKRIKY